MIFRKTFVLPQKVLFEEVDAGAAVHHPNYLKYMERGRCQAMEESGLSFGKFMAQGFALVVSEINSKYLRSLRIEESFYVVSRVVAVRKSSTKVLQAIVTKCPSENVLIAAGDNILHLPHLAFAAQVRLVCVNLETARPHEFPEFLKAKMHLPSENDFENHPVWRDVRITLPAE